MQGTLVMLVGLSGLGCHNKGCDVAYVAPTYSSCFANACYANWPPQPLTPACYSGCYGMGYSGCYGGGYGGGCYGSWIGGGGGFGSCYGGSFAGCYGGGCYTGFHRRHGCGMGLFSCFHKKRAACYGGMGYGAPYAPPVFGSALGMSYPPYTDMSTPTGAGTTATGGPTGTGTPGTATGVPGNEGGPQVQPRPVNPSPGVPPAGTPRLAPPPDPVPPTGAVRPPQT